MPHFCCKAGAAPEIIGYYAANLNAGMPTVRSANPNALLFAFKNWKGLHKPPSNKLVEVVGTAPTSVTFIPNVSTSADIFKHKVDLLSIVC